MNECLIIYNLSEKMPSQSCAVFGCVNNDRRTVGITYFQPQTDDIKKNWQQACPIGVKNVKNFYICSEHFKPDEKKVIGNKVHLVDASTTPSVWNFLS